MASRTEKLRRRQKRKEKKRWGVKPLTSAFARSGGMSVARGGIKMSEALMALVKPEWHDCGNKEAMEKLLTIGVAGWNAALMNDAERTAFLDDLAQTLPVELRQDWNQVVEPFIRRKLELFPHIQRPIIGFDLTWLPSGDPYLSVVSALAP